VYHHWLYDKEKKKVLVGQVFSFQCKSEWSTAKDWLALTFGTSMVGKLALA
jgi:hypothetical protein